MKFCETVNNLVKIMTSLNLFRSKMSELSGVT